MAGQEVYRFAVSAVPECGEELLRRAGRTVEDVDRYIFHQANMRIIRSAVRKMGISEEKCFLNVEQYGNTSAASVAVALAECLERKLKEMKDTHKKLDVITFSGNGEPTTHPDFEGIVDDTIRLRNRYFPAAKVSVLSNSTMAHLPAVHRALERVDNNILKLDTVDIDYIRRVDRPTSPAYNIDDIISTLRSFHGNVIIQTMFMKGTDISGQDLNNTSDRYVTPWIEALKLIRPKQVMIYTIDRDTPCHTLQKATHEELNNIRDRVAAEGIECTAAY